MAFANLVVHVCWIVLLVYWVVSAWDTYKTKQRSPAYFGVLVVSVVIVVLGLVVLAAVHVSRKALVVPHTFLSETIASVMTVLGLYFAIWARRVLGKNWSGDVVVKEGHELITTGPYALVRHPIYTGILTMAAGYVILDGEAGALVVLLAVTAGLTTKIKAEEKLMQATFGEHYVAYRKRTKAIIPHVI